MRVGMLSLMVFLCGCVYVPPVWDAVDEIYQLDFIEPGVTTKDQVLARLGEPDTSDEGEVRYTGLKSTGAFIFILPTGLPIVYDKEEWWVTIEFDEDNVVSAVRTSEDAAPESLYAAETGHVARAALEKESRADLQKSAEEGDPEAAWELSQSFPQATDPRNNLFWLCRAANLGHTKAQREMGGRHWYGISVPEDRVRGFLWHSLAARNGSDEDLTEVAERRELLTTQELVEAERLIAEWQPVDCDSLLDEAGARLNK